MMFFKYLYYRMYKAYDEKNDRPAFRTFMYISLFHFFIGGLGILYIERILELFYMKNMTLLHKSPIIFNIVFFVVISLYTYLVYSRKSFQYYECLFANKTWLNTHIKLWMIIVMPFIILFGGIHLSILLFGGEIFGKEIIGVMCSLQ